MNKEMHIKKSDITIVLLFAVMLLVAVLLFGCSGNVAQPVFGVPDSVVVTTLSAIQGQTGYYFTLTRGDASGTTAEVVFGIAHTGVSPHPFYILVRDAAETPEGAAIQRLHGATHAGFAREAPPGYVLLGTKEVEVDIRLGQNTPTYSVTRYLFCTTQKGHKVYFPVRLTFDDVAYRKFWQIVNAGARVIGEDDPSETQKDFVDWLQQAPDGPAPAYITEVRYANNETIGTASEPNITVVRKQQEELVRAVYGNDYQNDRELHRALRVVDKMGEGFRQTWLDYVVNRNLDTLRMARDTIQRKETGLSYFTTNFTWFTLVLDIYEPIVGSLPSTRYGIVVEYLRLHFTYPNADEEELLDLFTQSVHNEMIITTNPWYAQ